MAGASDVVDDADARAADRIFNGCASSLLDLGKLFGSETAPAIGRSMMVSKTAPLGRLAATHTHSKAPSALSSIAGTVSTLLSPSVGQHSATPSEANMPTADTEMIFVIAASGDDRIDNASAGI